MLDFDYVTIFQQVPFSRILPGFGFTHQFLKPTGSEVDQWPKPIAGCCQAIGSSSEGETGKNDEKRQNFSRVAAQLCKTVRKSRKKMGGWMDMKHEYLAKFSVLYERQFPSFEDARKDTSRPICVEMPLFARIFWILSRARWAWGWTVGFWGCLKRQGSSIENWGQKRLELSFQDIPRSTSGNSKMSVSWMHVSSPSKDKFQKRVWCDAFFPHPNHLHLLW